MKLKTSFINKTFFLNDTLRFWPMWTLYLILLFFLLPVTLFRTTAPACFIHSTNVPMSKLDTMAGCINTGLQFNIIFIALMSIGYAILVFSYLFHANNCYMIHALPVKREELFCTGYLSGFLALAVPQILIFLMSLIVCIINNVTCVEYLLYWLIFSIGMSFLFYSAAVFCCMLTGNAFAALIYYLAGNLIYVGIKYLIFNAISILCYGMYGFASNPSSIISTKDGFLSPFSYLFTHVNIQTVHNEKTYVLEQVYVKGGDIIALYMIPAVMMLIFAVLFYRRRHLECAGDVVTFKWMKPIFRWVIAFCAGIGLAMILTELFFYSSEKWYAAILILSAAACTLICFFLSEMILKKRFRIFTKRCWIESLACAAFMLFILSAFECDLFRIEKRIPPADKISAALLKNNDYGMVLTDTDDIEALMDIHQNIIECKKKFEEYEISFGDYTESIDIPASTEIIITYYLTNGKAIARHYSIPIQADYLADPDSPAAKINAFQNDPDAYLKSQICQNYEDITFTSGYIDFPYIEGDGTIDYREGYEFTKAEAQIIYGALIKDIESGNYPLGLRRDSLSADEQYFNTLSFVGRTLDTIKSIYDTIPYDFDDSFFDYTGLSMELASDTGYKYTQIYPCFDLFSSCTYTIQALIDLGVIEDASDLTTWAEYHEFNAISDGE